MRRPSEMVSIDQAKEILRTIVQASQTYQRFLQANKAERILVELKRQGALLARQVSALNAFFGLKDALQAAEIKAYHITIFERIYPNFDEEPQQQLARFSELIQSLKAPKSFKKKQEARPSSELSPFLVLLISSAFFLGVVVIALVLNFVLPIYGLLFAVSLFGASVSLVEAVLIGSSIASSIFLTASVLTKCLAQPSPSSSTQKKVIAPPKNPRVRKSGFVLKAPRKKPDLAPNSPDVNSQEPSPPEVGVMVGRLSESYRLSRPAAISAGSPIFFESGHKTPAIMLTPGSAFGTPTPARVRALASSRVLAGGPALFDSPLRLVPASEGAAREEAAESIARPVPSLTQ